jgi:hypothetical protein
MKVIRVRTFESVERPPYWIAKKFPLNCHPIVQLCLIVVTSYCDCPSSYISATTYQNQLSVSISSLLRQDLQLFFLEQYRCNNDFNGGYIYIVICDRLKAVISLSSVISSILFLWLESVIRGDLSMFDLGFRCLKQCACHGGMRRCGFQIAKMKHCRYWLITWLFEWMDGWLRWWIDEWMDRWVMMITMIDGWRRRWGVGGGGGAFILFTPTIQRIFSAYEWYVLKW